MEEQKVAGVSEERHKIDVDNLVSSIHQAVVERKKINRKTLVRIIPENGGDFSSEYHPLEKYLWDQQIPCYLDPRSEGEPEDYSVDLRQLEIVYPNQEAL